MFFKRSSELAIRSALFLAQQPPGKLTPVREIADQLGASEAYLSKVTQGLVSAGLVRAFRGPGKGLKLGRSAEKITISSLVQATEGPSESDQCVLGVSLCSEQQPCALHAEWSPIRTSIHNLLEKTTLADLLRSIRPQQDEIIPVGLAGFGEQRGI